MATFRTVLPLEVSGPFEPTSESAGVPVAIATNELKRLKQVRMISREGSGDVRVQRRTLDLNLWEDLPGWGPFTVGATTFTAYAGPTDYGLHDGERLRVVALPGGTLNSLEVSFDVEVELVGVS